MAESRHGPPATGVAVPALDVLRGGAAGGAVDPADRAAAAAATTEHGRGVLARAPPDDAEILLAELGRAASGTVTRETAGTGPTGAIPPARPRAPRFCPAGFGDPPRQVESLYSAPCAPAWTGSNGGSTYKGVTATEVRIALQHLGHMQAENPGPIPTEPQDGEDSVTRIYRVFQEYFNRNFQLYGRVLRLYETKAGGSVDSPADARAAAVRADEEFKVFGAKCHDPTCTDEIARRGLVAFNGITASGKFLASKQAYLWMMDTTKQSMLAGEYLCKKVWGRPPQFNERLDATFDYGAPRKLGLLYFEKDWVDSDTLRQRFADCGGKFTEEIMFTIDPVSTSGGQSNVPTAITRMKAAGVTSVMHVGESVSLAAFTKAADDQGYFPEWVIYGGAGVDRNDIARLLHSPTQWRHAFGISPSEIARADGETECYRAYRSIDPDGAPSDDLCGDHYGVWGSLLQIANGIQMAGPNLTLATFRAGLHAMGTRPPNPLWSIGGGYGPGDWSYGDYVAELWWDPDAVDPMDGSSRGAYRYTRGGKRYGVGQIPTEDPHVFKEGVTSVR